MCLLAMHLSREESLAYIVLITAVTRMLRVRLQCYTYVCNHTILHVQNNYSRSKARPPDTKARSE